MDGAAGTARGCAAVCALARAHRPADSIAEAARLGQHGASLHPRAQRVPAGPAGLLSHLHRWRASGAGIPGRSPSATTASDPGAALEAKPKPRADPSEAGRVHAPKTPERILLRTGARSPRSPRSSHSFGSFWAPGGSGFARSAEGDWLSMIEGEEYFNVVMGDIEIVGFC